MSQTANQSEPARNQSDYPEDEIELIDLLRVIWKWKYLIIGGTLVCALAALVISSIMPKIYRIETVIRPGILSIEKEGKKIYIDTPQNIKALIETGIFDNEILNSFGNPSLDNIPKELKLKVTLPLNSSTIKVGYESPLIDQGIKFLDHLGELLTEEYRNLVKYYQVEIDRDINIKKSEISNITSIKQSTESSIKNIEKRIHELETEIVLINENTASLNQEKKKFLLQKKENSSILSIILYSNTIQQNLTLANDYKDEINTLRLDREYELQKISKLKNEIQRTLTEINSLDFKKNSIQNIQIMQKPYSSKYPVKPKKIKIVVLAFFSGILLMVLLSFFLEFISKNKVN
jgi:LPS O-antigen subunit length determinant protein (WzzB/FepE family)